MAVNLKKLPLNKLMQFLVSPFNGWNSMSLVSPGYDEMMPLNHSIKLSVI